jgi:hypothetical protein
MVDRERVSKERVEQIGLFDFAGLYRYMHWWLKIKEYYGVTEEKYGERINAKGDKDVDIIWNASKTSDYIGGDSTYFRMEQIIKFEIRGMTDVEVEIDGVKKKMQKGRIWIEIKGWVSKDYASKWDRTPFYRWLRYVYNEYIVPGRVEYHVDKVTNDTRDFKEDIKQFLDMVGKR